MGPSSPREPDGYEGDSSHAQRTDVLGFFPCTVIHAHFYVNYGTRVLFSVFCAIRDDEKEWWIIRQGNLGANTQAKPCTVHIGHGVNRSANHLQFISQNFK